MRSAMVVEVCEAMDVFIYSGEGSSPDRVGKVAHLAPSDRLPQHHPRTGRLQTAHSPVDSFKCF